MIKPTVTIEVKQQYGKELAYPVDDNAKSFCQLAGTKTLSRDQLRKIKDLGFDVQIKMASTSFDIIGQ